VTTPAFQHNTQVSERSPANGPARA